MFRFINAYCERTGPELFSEPVNLVTNGAFFVAAWFAWRAALAAGRLDWTMKLLIGLTVGVGVGSTAWHLFAQVWSVILDVAFITLFIVTYVGFAIWRYFGATRAEAGALAVAFLFFANGLRQAAGVLPGWLTISAGYFPALLTLTVCGGLLRLRGHPAGGWLLATAGVFVISLTFRSLDQPLCDAFPLGTHFMWHILNGVVLWMLMAAWLRFGARQTVAPMVERPA